MNQGSRISGSLGTSMGWSYRLLAYSIAGMTCAISLILTVGMCRELRPESQGIIPIAIGVVWELAKYYFAVMGLLFLGLSNMRMRLLGGCLSCIALVLVMGSIAASLGYLAELDVTRVGAKTSFDTAQKDLKSQIASLDQQITILTLSSQEDVAQGMRRRGLATLEQIGPLRAARRDLSSTLNQLQSDQDGVSEPGLFAGLASALEISRQTTKAYSGHHSTGSIPQLRVIAYLVVSVMLEVIGIGALIGERAYRSTVRPCDHRLPEGLVTNASDVPEACNSTSVPLVAPSPVLGSLQTIIATRPEHAILVTPDLSTVPAEVPESITAEKSPLPSMEPAYMHAKELVLSGKVQPTYRSLRQALRLGQDSVGVIVRMLLDDGVLRREGKRFVLV